MVADGIGLLCGLLKHFTTLKEEAPLVIVASHFHECFTSHLFDAIEHAVACYTMKIVKSVRPSSRQEELVFLYKLGLVSFFCRHLNSSARRVAKGRETISYGTHCARLNHVPEDVIARGFFSYFSSFLPSHRADCGMSSGTSLCRVRATWRHHATAYRSRSTPPDHGPLFGPCLS